MAERIQRRRTKGWRMPEGAVYVGRPSRWGNPYIALRGTVYGPSGGPNFDGQIVAYQTHAPASNAIAAAVDCYRRDIDVLVRSQLTTDRRHRRETVTPQHIRHGDVRGTNACPWDDENGRECGSRPQLLPSDPTGGSRP